MATATDMTGTRISTLKFSAKAIPHKMHMIARLMIAGVNILCPRVFATSEVIFIGQMKLPASTDVISHDQSTSNALLN